MARLRAHVISTALLAVFLFVTAGCSSVAFLGKPAPDPIVRLTQTESDEFIRLKVGRRLAIDLRALPGYRWVVTKAPDSEVMLRAYYNPKHDVLEGVPMDVMYFRTVGAGITSFRIEQVPERGKGPAIDEFSLTVSVEY